MTGRWTICSRLTFHPGAIMCVAELVDGVTELEASDEYFAISGQMSTVAGVADTWFECAR